MTSSTIPFLSNVVFLGTRISRKFADSTQRLLSRLIPERLFNYMWVWTLPEISENSNLIQKISVTRFQFQTRLIPGMVTPSECKLLLSISTFCGIRGDVIEIGSWLGLSTVYFAKGCMTTQNGKVYAVDTFMGNVGKKHLYRAPLKNGETIYNRFLKNIKSVGLEDYIVPCRMSSEQARKKLKDINARVVFIDACHEYEAVKNDILLWKGLLLKGGFLVLHDFTRGAEGCVQAIKEEVLNSQEFKCVLLSDSLLIAEKTK
ncbi:MAG: class I SAM-dependent methyltransferase [bacterium]|nr:class I SAM-dependent methyltransferase [bacterium]